MKRYFPLILLVVLAVTSVSCKKHKNPDTVPQIKLSETNLYVRASGERSTITIESTRDWTVKSDVEWCRLEAVSGKAGISTLEIQIEAQPVGMYDDRNAVITFSIGDYHVELNILQRQKNAIIISEKNITLSSLSHTLTVEVQANIETRIGISGAWITYEPVTQAQGLTASTLDLWIEANFASTQRQGYVVFANLELEISDTLYITQEAAQLYTQDEFAQQTELGAYFTKDSARLYSPENDQIAFNVQNHSFRLQNFMQQSIFSIVLDKEPVVGQTVIGKLTYRVPPKTVLSNETTTLTVVSKSESDGLVKLWSIGQQRGFIVRFVAP